MGKEHTRHWTVGAVRITRIFEMLDQCPCTMLLPDATPERVRKHAWLRPRFATDEGDLLLWFQSFVLESGGRRIVVDTCIGNDRKRAIPPCNDLSTSFLEDMTEAGFPPESIDTVLCTHLHFDHVGWNTRLVDGRWRPTFPNARYLFARREWEHLERELAAKGGETMPHVADSLRPVIEAGLADFVETDHRVTDEVWLEPSPGHTPGHVCVRVASRGRHAVITGDVIHNPIQLAEPDLRTAFCADHDMARRTRRAMLSGCEERQALLIGSHFCEPTAGRVAREGEAWRYLPEDP